MESNTFVRWGTANGWCDVCGQRFKLDAMRKRWDNLIVCEKDFELDHPQKYIKIPPENISLPDIRPRPPYETDGPACTVFTAQGLADIGTADCARADVATPQPLPYDGPMGVTAIVGYAIVGRSIVGSTTYL